MPKMKTRKAAIKRFKISGTGKIIRGQANRKHLLECKSPNTKSRHSKQLVLSKTDRKRLRSMLPGI